ncbi:outer membrane protein assembly factor BamB [Pseudoxanthomonas kalamensis DSM 18571]|uniref:outer membrane protein assembly factor BamB n=1 Tax=Pseudoxanthomonas kalamensis TaxID=289483 RepID=UPI0013919D20|nr:outer membrane protein assembly factor BamB [Pseudoxanthomonas kalamensis]KAF1709785.1 outer membrane protein assembly factor BamB [Pseudoxanthomonas kalamensis DSM 18571]
MMKSVFVKARATGTRALGVFAMLAMLAGCSTIKGWFGNKDKEGEKPTEPAELVDFTPTVQVSKLWSANVGDGEGRLGLWQAPAIADGRVYAAAVEGGVYALDLQTGKEIWRYRPDKDAPESVMPQAEIREAPEGGDETKEEKRLRKEANKLAKKRAKRKLDLRLSGGPGVGGGLVVIGTLSGKVIALDAANGSEKWRAQVRSEIISAPAIGENLVLVRGNDGTVTAFDAGSGEQRWFAQQDTPALTVRGNAPLVLGPSVVFVGNDNGNVTALSLSDGRLLWELPVGIPEGRSELDRMADVDGAPVLDGATLYATSYKQETVAIDGPSGRVMWTRDNGGVGGLALSYASVLVSDRESTVWALERYGGGALWSNPTLARRSLTAPTVQGDYAVVGDFDGYVHWLKLDDGQLAARMRAGGEAIRAKPVVVDGIAVVQNVEGELTAFKLD